MSTRGLVGFRIDGVDKVMYNHFDSYPSNLGERTVSFIHSYINKHCDALKKLKNKVRYIILVNSEDFTTNGSGKIWYEELRDIQGDLNAMLKRGVITNDINFIYDSLFCEWVYIINLDEMVFEIYMGNQTKPHNRGRYANKLKSNTVNEYQSCALVGRFPLNDIPDDWRSKLCKKLIKKYGKGMTC